MTATCRVHSTTPATIATTATAARLFVAFELSCKEWKLAFAVGHGHAPRLRTMKARDLAGLQTEFAKAKQRLGLPADTAVVSCYEAGRDGFWLHRCLTAQGVTNLVVDSSSIEVNRRHRRAKSDALDAAKLVNMLLRHCGGEKKVWSVVRVPTAEDEDRRCLHRELIELKDERTSQINRIKGLLFSQGLALRTVDATFPETLVALRRWDGTPVGPELQSQLLRCHARWQFVDRQIKDLEATRRRRIRQEDTPQVEQVRRLLGMTGVGLNGAWLLVMELFSWRQVTCRQQLGALVGLTPTPYQSGTSSREQGISKAGNRRLRRLMVELAWCWLQWQAGSELSQWYRRRFDASSRTRKVGIVALARKLLIALWRYLEHGEVPKGATLSDWRKKLGLSTAA